jgi:hypothetical protein
MQRPSLLYLLLITGEQSCLASFKFKIDCYWSELSGGSLLITGGDYPETREAVRLDTLRQFAVCAVPPMHTARRLLCTTLSISIYWEGSLLIRGP